MPEWFNWPSFWLGVGLMWLILAVASAAILSIAIYTSPKIEEGDVRNF